MNTLNFWPILVASVVSYGIGALWYSPILFGREWMALTKQESDQAMQGGMTWRYIVQFAATLVLFCVFGFIISESGFMGGGDGAFLGLLVWLGFSATDAVSGLLWQKKPGKLVLIQTIGSLVTLVVGGAIIGAWR